MMAHHRILPNGTLVPVASTLTSSPPKAMIFLNNPILNFVFLWLQVLTVVLVILATADLGRSVHLSANGESVSSADFYSPIIKIATFVSDLIS